LKALTSLKGLTVVVYANNAGGTHPMHGAYLADEKNNIWLQVAWTKEGRVSVKRKSDLDKRSVVTE
jgi:hypothetical protein